MPTSLLDLPDEVLKAVLQQLPAHERLICCLVHSRLHGAAVAATDALALTFSPWNWFPVVPVRNTDCFLAWLSNHGHHLTQLTLHDLQQPLRQLPCPHLQQLELRGGSVQLDAGGGHPGVLQACSSLTRFQLSSKLLDSPQDTPVVIDSLSALVQLQDLSFLSGGRALAFSGATLPRLEHLTYLECNLGALAAENLLQLGALPSLQTLVWRTGSSDAVPGPGSIPGFQLPASLKTLQLWCRAEAAILSVAPTGLQELCVEMGTLQGPTAGPSSFMAGMARLQQLTRVVLHLSDPLSWPPPGPAYSALTASSSLVELELTDANLPAGIWSHVFPASHRLPHLTTLDLYDDWQGSTPPWAWGAADVAALVSCCPNLQEVPAAYLQMGRHVSCLSGLTTLTAVEFLYGAEGATPASLHTTLQGLAALTQLLDLRPTYGCTLRVGTLLPLTSLARLTSFACTWRREVADVGEDDEGGTDEYLNLTATRDGSPPDVWLKLLQRCAAEADQYSARASLRQQLAGDSAVLAQQVVIMQQQHELTDLRQQLSAAHRRLSTQEQRFVEQQQVVQQQGDQIAALQGQLQLIHALLGRGDGY